MVTPASYDSLPPRKLPEGQLIEEAVCDFIVEYIHSDVLVSRQLVSKSALG
jgi:RNA-dependent RNA polymerase